MTPTEKQEQLLRDTGKEKKTVASIKVHNIDWEYFPGKAWEIIKNLIKKEK